MSKYLQIVLAFLVVICYYTPNLQAEDITIDSATASRVVVVIDSIKFENLILEKQLVLTMDKLRITTELDSLREERNKELRDYINTMEKENQYKSFWWKKSTKTYCLVAGAFFLGLVVGK